jgi:hypothetical protein
MLNFKKIPLNPLGCSIDELLLAFTPRHRCFLTLFQIIQANQFMKLTPRSPLLSLPVLQRQGHLTPSQIVSELRVLAYTRGENVADKLLALNTMVSAHDYPYKEDMDTTCIRIVWLKLLEEANGLRIRRPQDPAVIDTLERSLYVSDGYPTIQRFTYEWLTQRLAKLRKGTIPFPWNNTGEIIESYIREHGFNPLS